MIRSQSGIVLALLAGAVACKKAPASARPVTAESVQGADTVFTTMRALTDTVPAPPPRLVDGTNGAPSPAADADGPMTFFISGVDGFLITDPDGRRIGVVASSRARVHDIPGARLDFEQLCSDAPGEDGCTQGEWEADFNRMVAGTYRLEVVGSGAETFTLQVDGSASGVERSFDFKVDPIEVPHGAELAYELKLPPLGSGEPARLGGGFAGGHPAATSVLTYAAPVADTTTVPAGTDSVTIILFAARVESLSPIDLQWNDEEPMMRSIPREAPLRIRFPIRSGMNRLTVGATGSAGGQPLSQADTLVYLAP